MNRKNILAVIGAVVLLAAAFFISYGISYKSNLAADKAPSSAQTTASAQATAPAAEPSGSQDGETAAENEATTAVNSLQALPSPQTVEVPEEGWELTLINRYYKLSEYYEPRLDTAIEGSEVYLDSRVAEQFRQMYAAAQADGIDLTPFSGYVSFERQSRRFEDKTAEFMDEGYEKALAEVLASEYVMPAGCSEDNAGFSVCIGEEDEDFANSDAYKWLKSYAAVYGFIERYPAAKEKSTHVKAQPWRWRYVGTDAKTMDLNELCLEEYLSKVN